MGQHSCIDLSWPLQRPFFLGVAIALFFHLYVHGDSVRIPINPAGWFLGISLGELFVVSKGLYGKLPGSLVGREGIQTYCP